ncbi:MAG: bifunctional phosphopantothenoylcysteine decarboxylase/phosphopantothenate--cysteine ligase CoaBC [Acidobacteria bacterium]|nr:MAG: bifunctional phosphopantothenoylcysteine decarboxylase/phosphopantothenate--cysteine ligase CoaBC [Acidobacteriota bacterium]
MEPSDRSGSRPPRVVLGVTGGIAAYKSAEVVRRLVERGAEVTVMMTAAAQRFLTPLTLSVLSRRPVVADLWDAASGAVDHVELARRTDVLAVAPATADSLAKMARGVADDVLSTYALAHRRAVVVAPAMNTFMWAHEATVENLAILRARGASVVEPEAGDLACGDVGPGRLASPERVADAVFAAAGAAVSLEGRTVLVTAGPTREPIDPVRFLSNRSSGRMGYAVAREAGRRGATVVLVSGPVALTPPPGVTLVRVERTSEMRDAVLAHLGESDALVMAAAPADFVAAAPSRGKIKRAAGIPQVTLELAPDILGAVAGARRPEQVVVAFAAETEDLVANARRKLAEKGVDLLVANDVSRPGTGFDSDENEVILLAGTPDAGEPAEEAVPRASKTVVAGRILDRLAALIDRRRTRCATGGAPGPTP